MTLSRCTGVVCLLAMLATVFATPVRAEKAVNFEFTTEQGNKLRLSDFKGKWVLVNFWAPWCLICRVEVPAINKLAGRPDLAVISVAMDYGPNPGNLVEVAKKKGSTVQHLVAGGNRRDASAAFRQVGPVDFFPTSYLYDHRGEIVAFIPGQLSEKRFETLRNGLKHTPAPDK